MEKSPKRRRLSSGPQTSKEKTKDEGGGEETKEKKEGESSPARCPICLAPPENAAKSDSCSHYFCFSCLKEWSKVKAECPLCKMPIRSIFYDIKSDSEYGEYKVKDPRPRENDIYGGIFQYGGSRFGTASDLLQSFTSFHEAILRTTRSRFSFRNDRNEENMAAAAAAATNVDVIRQRRTYYWEKKMVRRVDTGRRTRDISAEFFRNNPSLMHRLEPWLRRELTVLYGVHNRALISRVRDIVMQAVMTVGITSQNFINTLQPYLLEHTNQFVHEFISFARSPYNIQQYDRHAHYTPERPARDWAPLRHRTSRWDSSPDGSENPGGPSMQSLMLSQTSWGDDDSSSGPRTFDPSYRFAMGYYQPRPRDRSVEAPLLHQNINVHQPSGSNARDYHRMEIMRRHFSEHINRNAGRMRHPEPPPAPTSHREPTEVIVISSDSEDEELDVTAHSSRPGSKTLHYHPRSDASRDGASGSKRIKTERPTYSPSDSDDAAVSSDGSDVEFVKYVKPVHLRTPDAFIDLSSGDDDAPGPSGIRSEATVTRRTPPVTSSSSGFSSDGFSSDGRSSSYRRRSSHGSASSSRHDALHRTKKFLERARRDARRRESSNEEGEVNMVMEPKVTSSNNDVISAAVLMDNRTLPSVIVMSRSDAVMSQSEPVTAHVSSCTATSQSDSQSKSSPKKIFEKGKVSVNFPRSKKFYDSDSDSEIDVEEISSSYHQTFSDRAADRLPSFDDQNYPDIVAPTESIATWHGDRRSPVTYHYWESPDRSPHGDNHKDKTKIYSKNRKNSFVLDNVISKNQHEHSRNNYRRFSSDSNREFTSSKRREKIKKRHRHKSRSLSRERVKFSRF